MTNRADALPQIARQVADELFRQSLVPTIRERFNRNDDRVPTMTFRGSMIMAARQLAEETYLASAGQPVEAIDRAFKSALSGLMIGGNISLDDAGVSEPSARQGLLIDTALAFASRWCECGGRWPVC